MNARRLILAVLASLCALAGGLLVWSAPALAARGHVFKGSFGEKGAGNGQLEDPSGVAVNEATGDVYVVDKGNNRVERFSSSGAFLGQFNGSGTFEVEGKVEKGLAAGFGKAPGEIETGQLSEPEGIAVDNACYLYEQKTGVALSVSECEALDPSNGDVYVVDAGHKVIDKFSATGKYVGQITGTSESESFTEAGAVDGVAVGSNGTVWVYLAKSDGFSNAEIDGFSDAVPNEFLPPSRASQAGGFPEPGFAVDSEGDFYVVHKFGKLVAKLTNSGEILNEEVEGEGEPEATGVTTELSSDDVYIDNGGTVSRLGPEGSPIEPLGVAGMNGSGVGLNSASGAVYVADSVAGDVHAFELEELSKPTVESETISDISGNSATFNAEINPRGSSTEYRFEYGPSEAYGASAPIPDGSVGSGFEVYGVGVHLQDLQPGTTYHYRVVAHNEKGTTDGEDRTFTTQTAGALALLDGREWEMVSPPDKLGAGISEIGEQELAVQASVNGDALIYVTSSPTEAGSQGYTQAAMDVLARRGPDGWASQDLGIPHPKATGGEVGFGLEYRFFSEDLSLGLVQPFGVFDPSLSPEASEQTAFLRTDYLNGNVNEPCLPATMHCYHPLVTGAPGYANVPPGTIFGLNRQDQCTTGGVLTDICGPQFVGATPDLSHVLLESAVALTPGSGGGLYEWSAGRLTPVPGIPQIGERHGISEDGSRVISTGEPERTPGLVMRDIPKEETIQLDAVQGGSGESGTGRFQVASPDDSRVFFTDDRPLIAGAADGNELYECEMVEVAGKLTCKLSDLTPSLTASGSVLGGVLGASEDGCDVGSAEGCYVYFVANGVLAEGAVPGTCGEGYSELCNLYVWHGGVTKLVAVLSGNDASDWSESLTTQTARVSPSGQWLAFMSQQDLTGYSTLDAVTGKPDEEVYLYDASSGRLVCASCNPTGARPVGNEKIAANIPGWTPYTLGKSFHQSRYLSDSGRLFFNSNDALVAQDVNGAQDVYEFEPPGVGSCGAASSTFSERLGGCVDLISSGTSAEESVFLEASGSGGDVFFLTTAKLAPQDYDTADDVYDAHECTTVSPCFPALAVQPPPCTTGDACKPSPTPQPSVFGAPSSATFSGAGNIAPSNGSPGGSSVKPKGLTRAQKLARALRACRERSRGKGRSACERQARARYAARQSRKTGNARKRGRG